MAASHFDIYYLRRSVGLSVRLAQDHIYIAQFTIATRAIQSQKRHSDFISYFLRPSDSSQHTHILLYCYIYNQPEYFSGVDNAFELVRGMVMVIAHLVDGY